MTQILQRSIPYDVTTPRKLPGIQPLDMADWLKQDDAFAGQMARRDALLTDRREAVLGIDACAEDAALELLEMVLAQVYPGATDSVTRADGVTVTVDRSDPMGTLGRLVQEDFCILQKHGNEHVLTAAVLCFPASWTLSEKFMRPLIGIHDTVEEYDANMATRVQRLFDGVQVGRPLWRFNALWYIDPELHQPRSIHDRREQQTSDTGDFMRSEKQMMIRLPKTNAVVFTIHTYVVARSDLLG